MEIWLGVGAGLCGWAVGLLVGYLADWLPARRNQAQAVCPGCQALLALRSYLPWPRSCPQCRRKPPLRNWLAPVALAAAGAWLSQRPSSTTGPALELLILAYFCLVLVIDIEHRRILHITSLAGAALGLAAGWLRNGLPATLLGGLAALLIMLLVYLLGKIFGRLLTRLPGRTISEVPFGFGDVLLATVIGLMTGWPEILRCLFIAILAAGAFSLVYLVALLALRRYKLGTAIPYAPFLIFAGFWAYYAAPLAPLL